MIFGDSPIRPEEILQFIKSETPKTAELLGKESGP